MTERLINGSISNSRRIRVSFELISQKRKDTKVTWLVYGVNGILGGCFLMFSKYWFSSFWVEKPLLVRFDLLGVRVSA